MNQFVVKSKIQAIFLTVLVVLFSSVGVSLQGGVLANESDTATLNIVHTNDIHAKINNFGKIGAYIEAQRENYTNFLYLDAGDIFSGNPVVDLKDGEPIIELLNAMQLDAMTIGNHEFDYGQEVFAQRVLDSSFPWLSANTEVVDETIAIEQPDPFEIFEFEDGLTVGVLGLTQAPPATAPAGIVGLQFHDPVATALEYEYLADEVDLFVALTHIGYSEDRRLAESVDFIDVIIGGHSHTTLSEPQFVNGTAIAQTGGDANNIGNLELELDLETGEVEVTGFLQQVSQLEATNDDIQAMVDSYNAEAEELLNTVIGYTNTGLTRDGRNVGDVPLGNFWMDAVRYSLDADISLTNGGGIRASIAPGDITAGDIFTVEPFGNIITEKEMTGAALKDVIEYSYSWRKRIDLQTSGLHYTIYTDQEGNYIDADLYVDGEPIDMDQTYTVALNNFIATGGDGYNFVGETVQEDAGYVTNAMINYAGLLMEEKGAIDYEVEGRIQVKVVEEEVESPFTDVRTNHWAFDYIYALTQDGIINGYEDGTFKPSNNISRAHFAALLTRTLGLEPTGNTTNPFKDVSGEHTNAIIAAYEAGIVQGKPDGTFAPRDNVSREQMVLMLMRAYEYETGVKIDVEPALSFEDNHSISAYAMAPIQYSMDLGIIQGKEDGRIFDPRGGATRAQAAKVLYYFGKLDY
jgi:5'-nucleotidase / UDP-sugar diphosphatase